MNSVLPYTPRVWGDVDEYASTRTSTALSRSSETQAGDYHKKRGGLTCQSSISRHVVKHLRPLGILYHAFRAPRVYSNEANEADLIPRAVGDIPSETLGYS